MPLRRDLLLQVHRDRTEVCVRGICSQKIKPWMSPFLQSIRVGVPTKTPGFGNGDIGFGDRDYEANRRNSVFATGTASN
jgi:hypothetical protein